MYLFQVTYPQFRWFLSSVWLSLRVGSFPTTPTAADDRSLMKLKLLHNRQRTNFIHAPMTFTGLPPPSASRNQHLVISIINKCAWYLSLHTFYHCLKIRSDWVFTVPPFHHHHHHHHGTLPHMPVINTVLLLSYLYHGGTVNPETYNWC